MKLFKVTDYPNFLHGCMLTAQEIEKIIRPYSLSFSQTKDKQIEWGMSFPMFLYSFYEYITEHATIPDQSGFWNYYQLKNSSFFQQASLNGMQMEALKARIYRTYPSLVRDFHFSTFLKEQLGEASVIYNQNLDVVEGIDVMINHNGTFYAVNLYTNTSRAFVGREKKETRHTKFTNVSYIELPVDFKGSYTCGDFFLYKDPEVARLNEIIFRRQ